MERIGIRINTAKMWEVRASKARITVVNLAIKATDMALVLRASSPIKTSKTDDSAPVVKAVAVSASKASPKVTT